MCNIYIDDFVKYDEINKIFILLIIIKIIVIYIELLLINFDFYYFIL